MVENIWEKIAENLDCVKNSNVIRGSTKAAVSSCFGADSLKNTNGRVVRLSFQLYHK